LVSNIIRFMKLLLTSGGLSNNSIISSLKKLTEKPFSELNLAFIPTAANIEAGDKTDWFLKDLEICKNLGFKSIDLVDISALPKKIWTKRIEESQIIMIEGGNTYHLMYWVRKSGLEKLLPELLKTRVYIGISAGSMIMAPSLDLSSSEKGIVEDIAEKIEEKGLGFVDFLIEPHINSPYFPDLTFVNFEKQSKNIELPIYALDDNSAIEIIDDKITVISEGNWKKFN
jgi:dipeptidase E